MMSGLRRTVYEPELLGSAGTLAANRQWVDGEEFFLACYADNLTDFDLRSLIDAHMEHGHDRDPDGVPLAEPVGRRCRGTRPHRPGHRVRREAHASRFPTW